MSPTFPAIVFAVLVAVSVGFQLALAAGMPWGVAAMGGRFPGRLPPPMRVAAVFQSLVLLLLGGVVLVRAGLTFPEFYAASRTAVWIAVATSAIAAVLNLITSSRLERAIWAPVAIAMLATSVLVALS